MKKVVITGMGMINSLGKNKDEVYQSVLNNKCGIKNINGLCDVSVAAKIIDFNISEQFSKKEIRSFDLATMYGIIAAREAHKDAGLENYLDRNKIGVNVTSGIGGIETMQKEISKGALKGYHKIAPSFIPKSIINLLPGNIAIDLNANGISNSIVTACASSTDAIGHAMMYIQNGLVDVMVTGGSEASICEVGIAGFANIKALSTNADPNSASAPFDKNRSGFVMGEGSCVLVLESLDSANERGAKIYGEVVSYGATCDAHHITAPKEGGEQGVRACEIALTNAKLKASDVRHVNCHGTSTVLNDQGEIEILKAVYKEEFKNIKINSFKGHFGHLLGAAGSTEVALTILSLNEGKIYPCLNTKDVELDGNIVMNDSEKCDSKYALKQSLGFGGHNACLILKGNNA